MVQGLPAVDWKKAENNAKLFAAVLSQFPGTPNYNQIAKAFGPNVPASAISYRLNVVRKEGAAVGFSPSTPAKANRVTITTKRAAPATKKNIVKGNGRQGGKLLNIDSSDETDMAIDSEVEKSAVGTDNDRTPTTPGHSAKRQKTISGRVTKRVSPRARKETNYKKLNDPFVSMDSAKDEHGDDIFGEPSGTESEDTYVTGGSFKEHVKMEEEAA